MKIAPEGGTISAVITATVLASILVSRAEAFPTYGFEDGKTYTYSVKAKAEIQPYSIGGKLKLKVTSKDGEKSMLDLLHEVVFIQGNESGPGNPEPSIWEVNKRLVPTGTGQGANQFGQQLMASLALPAAESERTYFFGAQGNSVSSVKVSEKAIVVSSKITDVTGTHTIERTLDPKTRVLLKSTCVSALGIGKTTYELTLDK